VVTSDLGYMTQMVVGTNNVEDEDIDKTVAETNTGYMARMSVGVVVSHNN